MAELGVNERSLVDAATRGDEDAFRQLVEPLDRELHVFCYRMLGSFHDAEDALQDALVKAWHRLSTYDSRASFRAWTYKIATNTCLDMLRQRRRRVLPQDIGPPVGGWQSPVDERQDIPWMEPYPDSLLQSSGPEAAAELRESVRLAFVRALQLLPPRQRAVLILRDVLDWRAAEVAAMLESSVASVNSALQRARATVAQQDAEDQRPLRSAILDEQKAALVAQYVRAWETGNVDAIVAMLTEDAVQSMPPWTEWMAGHEQLRVAYSDPEGWDGEPRPGVFRILPFPLNGEIGFAEYRREGGVGPCKPLALTVATVSRDGAYFREITSFMVPDLFEKWGLPASLD